jgi:hypothetical protein
MVLLLAGFAIFQISLVVIGAAAWPCPFQAIFGVQCPGCGLTRSMVLLLQGELRTAVATHAFAPLLLVTLIFLSICGLLPRKFYNNVTQKVAVFEKRTGIATILVFGLLVYWGFQITGVIGY